jgi:hypothetical protein
MLCLGKRSPPDERHEDVDEEGLANALAPLTNLTRLHLKDCGLGAIPAEVTIPCCCLRPSWYNTLGSCQSRCSDTLHAACRLHHRHQAPLGMPNAS